MLLLLLLHLKFNTKERKNQDESRGQETISNKQQAAKIFEL